MSAPRRPNKGTLIKFILFVEGTELCHPIGVLTCRRWDQCCETRKLYRSQICRYGNDRGTIQSLAKPGDLSDLQNSRKLTPTKRDKVMRCTPPNYDALCIYSRACACTSPCFDKPPRLSKTRQGQVSCRWSGFTGAFDERKKWRLCFFLASCFCAFTLCYFFNV